MKLLNLLTNTNQLDNTMSVSEKFNSFKNQDHSDSLDDLSVWLDQQSKKRYPMKKFYKVVASFLVATLILVACTVPVQHEEEIGFMVKGLIFSDSATVSSSLKEIRASNKNLATTIDVYESTTRGTVLFLFPDIPLNEVEHRFKELGTQYTNFDFEILPIEETIQKPVYKSVLAKFSIHIGNQIPDSILTRGMNNILAKSKLSNTVTITTDDEGNKQIQIHASDLKAEETKDALNLISPNQIKSIRITKNGDDKMLDIRLNDDTDKQQE